jgi:hypothetical protein
MPDRDNLSKTLKKPWGGAINAARQGPEVLARFAAAVTTEVIADMGNGALLEALSTQLSQVLAMPVEDRANAVLCVPEKAESSRESLIAVKAAERVLVEIVIGNSMTPAEVHSKFLEAYCLEIPKTMCLGIIGVKVPNLYPTSEIALQELGATEHRLKELLQTTARELEANLNNPKITKLKKPRRKRRKSQEELVTSTPKMNLGNL